MRWPWLIAVLALLVSACPVPAQDRYKASRDPNSPQEIPYARYFTRDKFRRRIVFYISAEQDTRLPLVLVILGSGPFSNFRREGDRIVDAHGTVRAAFAGKAHVMAVEKPGVEFLQQPVQGDAHGFRGPPAFQMENSLPRWVEAVSAALRAARGLPGIDPGRTLIIGHSEGALTAGMVARQNSFVTHVASLAGNGLPIPFELEIKAREGRLYPEFPGDPARQLRQLKLDLAAIRRDPASTTKVAIGHTHIYWASRLKPSTMKTLSRSKARIFLAHGTADRNVSFENFRRMSEVLRRQRRDVTEFPVPGGDHGFRVAPSEGRLAHDAWGDVIARVRQWFSE